MDTNAVGNWQLGNITTDANGISATSTGPTGVALGGGINSFATSESFYSRFPANALIGYIGTPPAITTLPATNQSDPNAFMVGTHYELSIA